MSDLDYRDELDPLGFRAPQESPDQKAAEERLFRVSQAYDRVFSGGLGEIVLEDLYQLILPEVQSTAIGRSTDGRFPQDLDPGGRISAFNDGMKAVWWHIVQRRRQARAGPPTLRFEDGPGESGEPAVTDN